MARRLRARLPAPVTIWTAGADRDRAGLTVSSTLVADGEPGRLLGLLDPESELWTAIEREGHFAVSLCADRQRADRFAGLLPAPGGLFAQEQWQQTPYGPVPADVGTWAGCRLDTARPYGWGMLVEATLLEITLAEDELPLVHLRGRYHDLAERG